MNIFEHIEFDVFGQYQMAYQALNQANDDELLEWHSIALDEAEDGRMLLPSVNRQIELLNSAIEDLLLNKEENIIANIKVNSEYVRRVKKISNLISEIKQGLYECDFPFLEQAWYEFGALSYVVRLIYQEELSKASNITQKEEFELLHYSQNWTSHCFIKAIEMMKISDISTECFYEQYMLAEN